MNNKLKDAGVERTLISTILKHGPNAFIDADGIVSANDFAVPINRAIYSCFAQLVEDPNCKEFDIETIKLKAASLQNLDVNNAKNIEYLELLSSSSSSQDNIPVFAMQVKKFSVMREIYDRYTNGMKVLDESTGNETLSEIIAKAEGSLLDYLAGNDNANTLEELGIDVEENLKRLLEADIVDQIGVPTGFPIWDTAIGGGLRGATVNMIGSRAKVGKSWDALNKARNIAKRNIPVLYLDSELTKEYQQNRLMCIDAQCPITLFENGKFKLDKDLRTRVIESAYGISRLPLTYESISGKSPSEVLAIARRWLVKKVGFQTNGHANPCVIVYDYIKLVSSDELSGSNPEHIAIGFLMTQLHNFTVKYNVPILGYMQLNRDGIDNNDSSIVASSDRILWLCSSLSFIKNKDETDVSLGDGWANGNKRLIVCETRYGSGLENELDYINLIASIRPNVGPLEACGLIREGYLHSEVASGARNNNPQQNKPRNDSGDQGSRQSPNQ